MNKCFQFIIPFLILSLNAFNQNSRFPVNPKGTWDVNYVSFCTPDEPGEGDDVYKYFIENDTFINEIKYYKLYKSGIAYYEEPFYYTGVYAGALRDTANKFYFVDKDESSEQLLFDFNLTVGDTIRGEIGKDLVINDVDTLPDGRKKIFFMYEFCAGCCPVHVMVEGIGHAAGFTEEPPCHHPCFRGHYMTCYRENNKLVYSSDYGIFTKPCKSTSSVPAENVNSPVQLYPSPVTGLAVVGIKDQLSTTVTVTVFNLLGTEIYRDTYFNQSGVIHLDLSGINKGIYFLRINGIESYPVIKFYKE